MKRLNVLSVIILSMIMFSCATFSKNGFRKKVDKLEETDITKINGDYSFYPLKKYIRDKSPNNDIPDSLRSNNAYDFLMNENYQKRKEFDSQRKPENKYQVRLNLIDKKNLKIEVLENLVKIKDTLLTGKYKKGMFYLDNKFLECHGVPYIFGGCNNNKRRIGLTKNGNLLVNEAIDNSGALLLIIGAGYSYNITYEYERN